MMKKSILLMASLFLSFFAISAQDLNLEQVLENHFKAIGQEKLSKTQTIKMTGTQAAQGMEMPFTIYIKRPGKIRIEVSIQGSSLIQAYNGETGWTINPFTGNTEPQELSGAQLGQVKKQANIDGNLYYWKEDKFTAELIGTEDVDSVKTYKIKLTEKPANEGEEESIVYYYINAENFFIKKVTTQRAIQGQLADIASYMSDYRNVDGIYFPFLQETKMFGNTVSTITFDKIILNPEIDDVIFEKPVK